MMMMMSSPTAYIQDQGCNGLLLRSLAEPHGGGDLSGEQSVGVEHDVEDEPRPRGAVQLVAVRVQHIAHEAVSVRAVGKDPLHTTAIRGLCILVCSIGWLVDLPHCIPAVTVCDRR